MDWIGRVFDLIASYEFDMLFNFLKSALSKSGGEGGGRRMWGDVAK